MQHMAAPDPGNLQPRGAQLPPTKPSLLELRLPELQGASSCIRPPALSVTRPTFARHDTFAPRFGWLRKGYDAAVRDPSVFSHDDAPVILGVGKNMVRAIKHWCLATGLIEDSETRGRAFEAIPTAFGEMLLGQDGADPYLEDLGSLWLLHWRLVGNADLATGWWYSFFRFDHTEFEVEKLTHALDDFVARQFPTSRFAHSSYKKDASCVVRMYGEMPTGFTGEESIHCPFAELALIRPVGKKHYAFQVGPKPGLSDEIIAFAVAEFALTRGEHSSTIPLGSLVRESGSPGLAFRLGEAALYAALERAGQKGGLRMAESGGLIQVVLEAAPSVVAVEMLTRHYAALV